MTKEQSLITLFFCTKIYFSLRTKDVRRISVELMFSSPPTRSVIECHRIMVLQ